MSIIPFRIKCCSMRTAIHQRQHRDEGYNTEEETALPARKPAGTMPRQHTHCSYCDQAYPDDEWEQVDLCHVERLSGGERCTMGMMHTRCVQAHMLEHHPKAECPVKYRQQEQARGGNDEVTHTEHQQVADEVDINTTTTLVLADTVDIRTTATLIPEVPCCSHCQEQFPLNQWIAASRCPFAEVHGAGECHAEFLHRHCVQLHYTKFHPQQKCPDEYRQLD